MKNFTKASLIADLHKIAERGWLPSSRGRNDGAVGHTLEDLLGLDENNLPLPNAAEWELKAQRVGSSSLVTLCHVEPSPRTYRFVPQVMLPHYGWAHNRAGDNYPPNERSFRMTISGARRSDRGFSVEVDTRNQRLAISFDSDTVDSRHSEWLAGLKSGPGVGELDPQPYWGFEDLEHKMGSKLHNTFFVNAHTRRINDKEEFWFFEAWMLTQFDFSLFIQALEKGEAFIDFDARTGHNHGTKFRIRKREIINLYRNKERLFSISE